MIPSIPTYTPNNNLNTEDNLPTIIRFHGYTFTELQANFIKLNGLHYKFAIFAEPTATSKQIIHAIAYRENDFIELKRDKNNPNEGIKKHLSLFLQDKTSKKVIEVVAFSNNDNDSELIKTSSAHSLSLPPERVNDKEIGSKEREIIDLAGRRFWIKTGVLSLIIAVITIIFCSFYCKPK